MKNFKLSCLILLSVSVAACLSNLVQNKSTAACAGADPSELEFFPVSGNCSLYLQCYNGEGEIMQCEDGLWWHQEITNCDYPGEYCTWENPPTTQSSPPTSGPIGSDPRCVDSSLHYWPHAAFCHRYIECYRGDSYEMACPPSLFFSTLHQECVNAEDSECCLITPSWC